jgi:hypothetical protein
VEQLVSRGATLTTSISKFTRLSGAVLRESTNPRIVSWLGGILGIIGFPALFLLSARVTLMQAGSIDAFVYDGYALNYADTLTRYGPTYYSSRVAFIFLERLFGYLFGLEPGYFALRYVALAAAAGSAYAIATRYFSVTVGLLTCAWLCLVPWLARSVLTTYVDGVACVYLLAGIAFVLAPKQLRTAGHFAAGATFALAVNCNLVIVAVIAVFMPAWAYLQQTQGFARIARDALVIAGGFVFAYLCLTIAMRIAYPQFGWFFESTTVKFAFAMAGGVAANWFVPLDQIIKNPAHSYLLMPAGFAAVVAILSSRILLTHAEKKILAREQRNFVVASAIFLLGVITLALGLHLFLKVAWLSLHYYCIYFLPACILALISVAGVAEARLGAEKFRILAIGNITLIAVIWLAEPRVPAIWTHLDLGNVGVFFCVAAILVTSISWTRSPAASACVTTGLVIIALSTYLSQRAHDGAKLQNLAVEPSERSRLEWDVYEGAVFLEKFVSAHLRPDQVVGFWYSNEKRHVEINSVQSVFLWGYSRLGSVTRSDPGMPLVNQAFTASVSGTPYVVLLGLTRDEVEGGLEALRQAGFAYKELERQRFEGRVWGYTADLISLIPPARTLGSLLFSVPLARMQTTNGGSTTAGPDGLWLVTATPQWAYSLSGQVLQDQQPPNGPIIVRTRVRVSEGALGISVSAKSDISKLIQEIFVTASEELQTADLDIPIANDAGSLIFRNVSPNGASRAVIESVNVYHPN